MNKLIPLLLIAIMFTLGCISGGGQPPPVVDNEAAVTFVAPANLPAATVGVYYTYSFCQPALAIGSDLCGGINAAANPVGGQDPYYFKLGQGVGFPPFGLILKPNGILDGVPSAEGARTFEVCAADQDGDFSCNLVALNVGPAGASDDSFNDSNDDDFNGGGLFYPKEPEEDVFNVTILSADCVFSHKGNTYEDSAEYYYNLAAIGTATGPPNAHIQATVSNSAPNVYNRGDIEVTSSWTDTPTYNELTYNKRGSGDPESTTWAMDYVGLYIDGNDYDPWPSGDDIRISVKILEGYDGGLGTVDTIFESVECPQP